MNQPAALYTAQGIPRRREGHRASRSGGFYPYTILPRKDGHLCKITRSGRAGLRFFTPQAGELPGSGACYVYVESGGRFEPDGGLALTPLCLSIRELEEQRLD